MRPFAVVALSAGALFSLVQFCPAPFSFLGALGVLSTEGAAEGALAAADGGLASMAGGAIAGGIGAAASNHHKRQSIPNLPPGVSQQSVQQCQDQLKGAHITLTGTPPNTVQADGVPPACMDLATVLTGHPTQYGGAVPIPMGSASLKYTGLTQDELAQLGQVLKAKHLIS